MSFSGTRFKIFSYFCIAVAIFASYVVALNAPFLWDDEVMVLTNPLIRSLSSVQAIFTGSAFGGSFSPDKFYRPVQIFTYALDYKLWGLNALGFRLTSLVIHFLAIIALFEVLKTFFNQRLSLLLALFFAVHPIHIESVTYISGRGDSLNLLATCGVLFLYFCKRESIFSQILFCIIFILGLISKENIVVLPLAIVAYALLFRQARYKVALIFSLAVALLFSAFRLLSDSTSTTLSLINEASFLERIYTVPTILWTYVRLFFWPYPLHMEYHFVESSLWNYSALFIVFVLVAVYIAYKTLSSKEFLFGILFFVIMLLPVSQIVFPLASTIREHWLALPSIGLLLVLGLILEKLYAKVWLFFLGIIFVFAMLTVIRNLDWTDAKRLYSHDLKFEANSFVMHNNLGLVYYRENNMSQAELCFRRSIEISPNQAYDVALNNLGVIEENKQRYQQAANLYYRSIQVGQYQLAYVNLARLAFQVNDYDAAIKIGEEGLKKYPNNSSLEQIIEASYKNKR